MSERLIEELNRENLCTHFVLPLLKLNKFSFVASNFVNSYLHFDSESKTWSIIVQIIEPTYCHGKVWLHPNLLQVYKDTEYVYVQYYIVLRWYYDVETFLLGKFSEMSDPAKKMIRTYSGLPNREVAPNGAIVTDGRLLALDKSPVLKDMWDRIVHPDTVNLDGMELLSIPDQRSYIDLSTFTKIKRPG